MTYYRLWFIILHPKLIPYFPFFEDFKSEFLIQDLISQLIINENGISICQNLSLGVENQKQMEFYQFKISLLFNGSLNTLRFFHLPGITFSFGLHGIW